MMSEENVKNIQKNVADYLKKAREKSEDNDVTMDKVVKGLYFIAKHSEESYEELAYGLINNGCTFTLDDLKKVEKNKDEKLYDGLNKGYLASGASVIINMRDNLFGWSYAKESFVEIDGSSTIYSFVRAVTGDSSFTKANIDAEKVKNIQKNVADYLKKAREKSEDNDVTMDKVVKGLYFIAKHSEESYEELAYGLINNGCTFTLDDLKKVEKNKDEKLYDGLNKGYLASGASVIVNMRDNLFGWSYAKENFVEIDGSSTIYSFIRAVTGDSSFTKANIDADKNIEIEEEFDM